MENNKFINTPFVKILVYANVFISICSAAQVYMTYILFDIPFNFDTISYIFFVVLCTYFDYNAQRVIHFKQNDSFSERSVWINKNKKALLISVCAAITIAVFFLCNDLSWTSLFIMFGAGLISFLYSIPPFNLRSRGYLKPFIISLIWAVSCVLIPLIEFSSITTESIYFLIAKFLFIAELCVVFDINDSDKDFRDGVFTYANKLGLTFTRIFCIVLLTGSGIMYGLFIKETTPIIFAAVFLSLCAVLSLMAHNGKHAFYYYLVIDGLMLIQPVFYLMPFVF